MDTDDEVRDRATFYLRTLESGDADAINKYIVTSLQVSDVGLENALINYVKNEDFTKPFDLKTVPISAAPITATPSKPSALSDEAPIKKEEKNKISRQDEYAQQLASIPEFTQFDLGPLFRSSAVVPLTESVTEYHVAMVKHTFEDHVVLQFDCRNTLNDQLLEKVYVKLVAAEDEGWKVLKIVSLGALKYGNDKGTTYVLLALPEDGSCTGSFTATLEFNVKDVDPTTGEPESDDVYADTFALEDIEITIADHVLAIQKPNFSGVWEQLGDENEFSETFALSINSLEDAVKKLQQYLGLAPCEHTERIPQEKSQHTLLLSGIFRGGHDVLATIKLALIPSDNSVKMGVTVR